MNLAMTLYCSDYKEMTPGSNSVPGANIWWWYKELIKNYAGKNGAATNTDRVFQCPKDRGWLAHWDGGTPGNGYNKPHYQNPILDFSSYVYNGATYSGPTLPRENQPNLLDYRVTNIKHPVRTIIMAEWPIHWGYSWHKNKFGNQDVPFKDAQVILTFVDGHAAVAKIYYNGFFGDFTAGYLTTQIPSSYNYQLAPD